jgi:hypothetical protein
VKPVLSSRFDQEILDGTQVFEVRVVYKPVTKDNDEERKGKRGGNLAVPAEGREDDGEDKGNRCKERCRENSKINKNLSSGEHRRRKRNCSGGQPRNGGTPPENWWWSGKKL